MSCPSLTLRAARPNGMVIHYADFTAGRRLSIPSRLRAPRPGGTWTRSTSRKGAPRQEGVDVLFSKSPAGCMGRHQRRGNRRAIWGARPRHRLDHDYPPRHHRAGAPCVHQSEHGIRRKRGSTRVVCFGGHLRCNCSIGRDRCDRKQFSEQKRGHATRLDILRCDPPGARPGPIECPALGDRDVHTSCVPFRFAQGHPLARAV